MKKDIAEKWVAALRSGEYNQCKEYMRQQQNGSYSYCCLGVLTDIVCTKDERDDEDMFMDGYGDDYLNPAIAERCGVTTGPRCQVEDIARSVLVKMNDEQGKSFNEIADYIEANWGRI